MPLKRVDNSPVFLNSFQDRPQPVTVNGTGFGGRKTLDMNIVPRRNFKKKIRVTKPFAGLKIGDELESVTLVKGNYSGLFKTGNLFEKKHIPVGYAEEI